MDLYEFFTIPSPHKSCKIAAFDLDDTLIKTKSGCKFPISEQDWMWTYESVPQKIKELQSQGYECMLFSNQYRLKQITKNKIIHICEELQIGAYVAKQKDNYRKPSIGMWELLLSTHETVDYEKSFFVGDAAGRQGDFSNSDLLFAQNIGVQFYVPEDFFA